MVGGHTVNYSTTYWFLADFPARLISSVAHQTFRRKLGFVLVIHVLYTNLIQITTRRRTWRCSGFRGKSNSRSFVLIQHQITGFLWVLEVKTRPRWQVTLRWKDITAKPPLAKMNATRASLNNTKQDCSKAECTNEWTPLSLTIHRKSFLK